MLEFYNHIYKTKSISCIKMNINVFLERENKNNKIELHESSLVKDLLNKLKINSVTVIVSRNNELISENEELKDNDEIRILPVISGG